MILKPREHRGSGRFSRLVWTLACVGLGAGMLAMGIQFRALTIVDRQYEWTKDTEERAARSLQSLRLERAAVFRDMEAHIVTISDEDRPERRDPASLNRLVAQCVSELAFLDGEEAATRYAAVTLEEAFGLLALFHQELERFEVDSNLTNSQLHEAWEALRAELVHTREATDKLEGRQRLQLQLLLRRYHNASGADAAELASRYIYEMESLRELRTLASELTDLALLAERLHGETEIDQLVSLKDNEIRQTLMRLNRATHEMAGSDRETLASHIAMLVKSMFGEGAVDDEAHQTLLIGEGGLFRRKLKSLSLERDGIHLRKDVITQLSECLEAERAFNHAFGVAVDANAIRADKVFRAAWRDTFISGVAVSVVFIILAWRLAGLGRSAEDELRSKNDSLEAAMDELEVSATTDKLTGLSNRAVFLDRLGKAIKRSRHDGSRYAVLFLDFDRFKVVNDSLGHKVGDALLCDIAKILRRVLHGSDTLARFGGDEFVVLLGDLKSWADAEKKAVELLDILAAPHQLGDHLIVSTASIGLVTNERVYEYPGDMIRDADAAMYQAKESGKAQVVVFDRVMYAKALERLSLETDLRTAVTTGDQFRLMYQPIVELETGRVTGFEALIRWDHPNHGVVSPAEFIPIAEDTGLIIQIGNWALGTAAAQLTDWKKRLGPGYQLKVNVNVSKRQLQDPSFMDDVLECQRDYGLQPGDLCLEITESTIADDRSDVIMLLRQLRELGFPIAMDDFGTGVSSLSTLHEYPIDVLKIDQAFIRVLDRDRSLLAVVMSITNLAENLGIKTVAEGIETADIVGALQSINCTWGQGYHFARPLSASDAEAYILNDTQQGTDAA